MRRNLMRQIFALTLFTLLAPALWAQFQNLYHFTGPVNEQGGIFKDVQGLELPGANGEAIVAVGSDNQAPPIGILAFHDVLGVPIRYISLTNPTGVGHTVDAVALCNTPNTNRIIACYFDPVDRATDIYCTDFTGAGFWTTRIPNFRVRDVVAGPPAIPFGRDRVWLTGHTTGAVPNVAVVGMDDLGAVNFFVDYPPGPGAPCFNTIGFEIDHNPNTNNLTVVGKTSINACFDGILVLRLQSNNGNLIWQNSYIAPNCTFDLKGKALVHTPGTFNNYTIAFEYKDPAVPGAAFPGLMEINAPGAVVGGVHYTTGAGFFNGGDFIVDGLDTDGNGFMTSGSFRNSGGTISGYSLKSNAARASVQFNEYETTAAYAPAETRLIDLDYYAATNQYLLGGHFRVAAGGAWPLWPTDVAFWLIATNLNGVSTCSTNDIPTDVVINLGNVPPGLARNPLVAPVASPLVIVDETPGYFDECTAKRGAMVQQLHDDLDVSAPTFAYLDGQAQILARIPATVEGQATLTLVDMQGRVLSRVSLAAGEHHIDAQGLSAGVYFLQFQGTGIAAGVQKIAIR